MALFSGPKPRPDAKKRDEQPWLDQQEKRKLAEYKRKEWEKRHGGQSAARR